MKYRESEYIGYDGTRMFMSVWLPDDEKARAVLIAIHGLSSHGKTLENIGVYFAQRGFAVFAPDMRGFGHYSGRKGHVMNFDEYVEDMSNIVMQVKDRFINKLTFLFGHSLGGQHVIRYVAKYPKSVDGIIISCPAVSEKLPIPWWKRAAARILSWLNIKKYFEAELDFSEGTHDLQVIEERENDPLMFTKVTPRFGVSGLNAAKEASRLGPSIRMPALVQQAGDDKLVIAEKTKEFYETLASEDKSYIEYAGYYHELHAEIGKEEVLKNMETWLEKRLPT